MTEERILIVRRNDGAYTAFSGKGIIALALIIPALLACAEVDDREPKIPDPVTARTQGIVSQAVPIDSLTIEQCIRRLLPPADSAATAVVAAGAHARMDSGAAAIARAVPGLAKAEAREEIERQVQANLRGKVGFELFPQGPLTLTGSEILETVVGYEIFKLQTYLTSGVFPKRYFGYFDRKWDTGAYEDTLLDLTHDVVASVNQYQIVNKRSVRLTDLEVLITYISEGGALILRERQDLLQGASIHLFGDLGCDNIGAAIRRYPALSRQLDSLFGTELAAVQTEAGKGETNDTYLGITRLVTFRESIVATGIMCLFEKEITEVNLRKQQNVANTDWQQFGLMSYPLDEQFIIGSLVFNSGLIFKRSTVERIRDFKAMGYLHATSESAAKKKGEAWHPKLPVMASAGQAFSSLRAEGYPWQPTSWSAVYHILQRYGAYVAIKRLTSLTDDGDMLRGYEP